MEFARLRRSLTLFEGESLLEGWAAERMMSGEKRLGLVMVTSWRLIFIDADRRLSAIPIAKIDEVAAPFARRLLIRAWYDLMDLVFDGPAAAGAVLNLMRRNPAYAAREGEPGEAGAVAITVIRMPQSCRQSAPGDVLTVGGPPQVALMT